MSAHIHRESRPVSDERHSVSIEPIYIIALPEIGIQCRQVSTGRAGFRIRSGLLALALESAATLGRYRMVPWCSTPSIAGSFGLMLMC